jgi:hypothetical protein
MVPSKTELYKTPRRDVHGEAHSRGGPGDIWERMLNRKEAELAAEVLKTRSLTERIELAAAAISWDSPWIPGEHAYTQVKERIDRALAILNATESPEAIAAPDPSPDPDDLQSTPDFTNEDLSPASTPKDPETPTLYQSHPDNTDFAGGVHEPLRSGPLTPTSPPGSTVQVVLTACVLFRTHRLALTH